MDSAASPVPTQQNPVQQIPESTTTPEIVRAEEVRLEQDVKMLTVGNVQGHYFLSCNKTLESCMTPAPGKDYLLFSKCTRVMMFPGAKKPATLGLLQYFTVTYNNQENIGLIPREDDPGPEPDDTWHPAIGMYWLRSWSKRD